MYSQIWRLLKGIVHGFPRTCQEVHMSGNAEGYYEVDPEQDCLEPILVYCNMSSNPVTAVLHHNREEWTHVHGYGPPGSYDGQVGFVASVGQTLITIGSVR